MRNPLPILALLALAASAHGLLPALALLDGGPVRVPLALGSFVGDPTTIPVAYEVRDPGTLTVVASGTAYPDATGTLSLAVASGTWDLALKPSHWLRSTVRNVAVADGSPALPPVAFTNGDVNGDDFVTAADRARVTAALGTAVGDPGYDPAADVTGDGFVTAADRAVVTANLGLQGDTAGAAADYRLALGGYPKTGGDAGNTGMGGGSGATGTLGWTAQVGTAAVGAVVVDGSGTVYAGSGGLVTAVSASGTMLWQASVAGTVTGLLVTRSGEVLVSAAKLTSLAGGGAVEWTFPDDFGATLASGEAPYAPDVLSDGTVVEATSARTYALDPYARVVRWSVPFASSGAAAVESDDTVVVWNSGEVRGLAGASGTQAFSQMRPANVDAPPASASTVGKTYSISASYGFSAPPCVHGNVVAWPEEAYAGTATGAKITSPGGHVTYDYNVNLNITSYLRVLSEGAVTSKTLASGTNIYVAMPTALGEDAAARFLLTYPGKTASTQGWSLTETGSGGASTGSDGTAYLATTNAAGLVKALDPATGAVRWTATLPSQGTGLRPAVGPDGTVYAGTTDGKVVQVR